MIYKAEFTAENLKSRLISPAIFGNIAKVFYDILPYEKANELVKKLGKTLISDMIGGKKLEDAITKVKEDKKKLYLDELYGKSSDEMKKIDKNHRNFTEDLKEKRSVFRDYKIATRNLQIDSGIKTARLRSSINRFNGKAEDGKLFCSEENKYSQEDIFCIYIKCDDLKIMGYIELAFDIIEKVGIGTDTSIGNGVIRFIRNNDKIFEETEDIRLYKNGNKALNIASTIITSELIDKDYKFVDYIVKRYDSKTPNMVKPFYHYIEAGSTLEEKAEPIGNIISDINGIKTYSCVFPIEI
ncbi:MULTISPECIES: hypothetical protein [Clostridium]|uniref:hypothetical protein n=1 Tax=Clostridium TaxID=1485 RepID=UPI000824D269|nr:MULTISPECIES: hypothetical protein [Clostridium]PJI06539.1 hypothetical protein CUB90_01070 [Clostridium sp. CT7]